MAYIFWKQYAKQSLTQLATTEEAVQQYSGTDPKRIVDTLGLPKRVLCAQYKK